jgi:hypothetical protein
MAKFKFEMHLKEADSSKEKGLLEGIRAHCADATMNIYETKILVVETDNPRVAEFLNLLNTTPQPVKTWSRKKKVPPKPEPGEV